MGLKMHKPEVESTNKTLQTHRNVAEEEFRYFIEVKVMKQQCENTP